MSEESRSFSVYERIKKKKNEKEKIQKKKDSEKADGEKHLKYSESDDERIISFMDW